MILLFTGCTNHNQNLTTTWKNKNFNTLEINALVLAKKSLNDFDTDNESNWLKNYDLDIPVVTSNIAYDKNGIKHNVYLVAFPSKDKKSWAKVFMPLNNNNLFEQPIVTGFSLISIDRLIKQINKIYFSSPF
jgi:hypothetical protein